MVSVGPSQATETSRSSDPRPPGLDTRPEEEDLVQRPEGEGPAGAAWRGPGRAQSGET